MFRWMTLQSALDLFLSLWSPAALIGIAEKAGGAADPDGQS